MKRGNLQQKQSKVNEWLWICSFRWKIHERLKPQEESYRADRQPFNQTVLQTNLRLTRIPSRIDLWQNQNQFGKHQFYISLIFGTEKSKRRKTWGLLRVWLDCFLIGLRRCCRITFRIQFAYILRSSQSCSNQYDKANQTCWIKPHYIHFCLINHQGKNFHWSFKKIREMAMTHTMTNGIGH